MVPPRELIQQVPRQCDDELDAHGDCGRRPGKVDDDGISDRARDTAGEECGWRIGGAAAPKLLRDPGELAFDHPPRRLGGLVSRGDTGSPGRDDDARTRAEREDTALLQFRLENGAIAHITTNWVTPYKTRTLQVATANKFVVADLMTRQVTEYFGQQPDGSYSTRGVMSWPNEPLKKELEAFAHAIRTGETPAVTGEDGLRNLEVALRCLGEA